jgi:hypothetical protein
VKVEQRTGTGIDELDDRFQRAAQILVTHETKQRYPDYYDALCAEPIVPAPPETRGEATPHILLVPPFQSEPDLAGVAIYVGIGFIEIRNLDSQNLGGLQCSYGFSPIGGDGVEARDAYLLAAFRLYFNDVELQETGDGMRVTRRKERP